MSDKVDHTSRDTKGMPPSTMHPKAAWEIKKRGWAIMAEERARELRELSREDWLHDLGIVWSVREPDEKFFRRAILLQRHLLGAEIDFCFIGGLALQRWGEVRMTKDIDLTIFCPLGQEMQTVAVLMQQLTSRNEDIENLATIGRMFLGRAPDGIKIDVSLGFMPYESRVMDRATTVDFNLETPLRLCSPEDLVIMKTVAGRDRDWADVRTIIERNGPTLDLALVFEEAEILLDLAETPDYLDRLKKIVAESL